MEEYMSRKILMLYPDHTCITDIKERERLHKLINAMFLIVEEANSKAFDLSSCYPDFYKACLPRVEMIPVEKYVEHNNTVTITDDEHNDLKRGLRICLVKFEQFPYSDVYKDIIPIEKYRRTAEISHLVAICINTKISKPIWRPSNEAYFDAVVETNLDFLSSIILSIIVDIMLYYTFGLPPDYLFRKSFANIKTTYVLNSIGPDQVKAIFCNTPTNLQNMVFLPISYRYIEHGSEGLDIEELFNEYSKMLIQHALSYITCTCQVKKPHNLPLYKDEVDFALRNHNEIEMIYRQLPKGADDVILFDETGGQKRWKKLDTAEFVRAFIHNKESRSTHFFRVCAEEV